MLRKYQEDTFKKIINEMRLKRKKILVEMPTGAGKTMLAQHIVQKTIQQNKKALFIVPRTALINQTYEKFQSVCNVSVIHADDSRYNKDALVHIGMLHTLHRRELPDVDLVIIDEVHWGHTGDMLQKVLKKYERQFIIGLSATPINEKGYLLEGWSTHVNTVTTKELIDMGFLSPYEMFVPFSIDTSKVSMVGSEYNQKELDETIDKKVMNNIVEQWQKIAGDKKTITFCSSIRVAEQMSEQFKCVTGVIHQGVSQEDRKKLFKAFHKNEIQMLLNVHVLTEGFDEPDVECVLLARPTKVLRTYIQMVGRGLRIAPNKKKCIIIDCGNNIKEHGEPSMERKFVSEPKFGKVVQSVLERETKGDSIKPQTEEEAKELKKIGSVLDLYNDKIYSKEQDLLEDVVRFLKKYQKLFFWRQNSGTMKQEGRWIHFTSVKGLPDITVLPYGLYCGIELKLPRGYLNDNQKKTFTDMTRKNVLCFIATSVRDVFDIMIHLQDNIDVNEDSVSVKDSIFDLSEKQLNYRKKNRIITYGENYA